MARTRTSLLDAAGRLVAEGGIRKTSMTDIAVAAGIAKGTLYNHFRSKSEVFAALAEAEVALLADDCCGLPLQDALAMAAQRVGAHPALRRVARDDPGAVAELAMSAPVSRGWRIALAAAAVTLEDSGRDPDAAELVVRWLISHAIAPDQRDADESARVLAAALPVLT
jgi:AcrR family transcriptional regulator